MAKEESGSVPSTADQVIKHVDVYFEHENGQVVTNRAPKNNLQHYKNMGWKEGKGPKKGRTTKKPAASTES